jgi:hypothetical protein
VVRAAVRDLLSSSQAFRSLAPEDRKAAAQAMVKVCQTAASLMQEEANADLQVQAGTTAPRPRAIAAAQSAGQQFSGVCLEGRRNNSGNPQRGFLSAIRHRPH